MEIVEQKSTSTYGLSDFDDKLNLGTLREPEEKSGLFMGWGACKECSCSGFFADRLHDGHCICGHTAADHN
jgi:hypothetical protein